MPLEFSIVIPSFNEAANVRPLIEKLSAVLEGIEWEAIFVDDDSPDGTADLLRDIAAHNPRIRVIRRIGRRGLASACIEGLLASSAPYLAIMDADLQHDETLLPQMLAALRTGNYDLAIASRYVEGGSVGDWKQHRRIASKASTFLSAKVLGCTLSDPMSGFFALTETYLRATVRGLSGLGFKLLLDLVVSGPAPPRYTELPYTFKPRVAGDSKLSPVVILEYFELILEKKLPSFIPLRLVLFFAVGLIGAVGHLAVFVTLFQFAHWSFLPSQAAAALCAMTVNFILNNSFTYREVSLRGFRFAMGLLSFYVICSLGAYLNLEIAGVLNESGQRFWVASLVGAFVGGLWNHSVSSVWTWTPTRRM